MSDWRINNGDFEEDDVWSLMKSHDDHSSHNMSKDYIDYSYSSSSSWHFPTTPRMIPRANHNHTSSSSSSSLVSHDDAKIPHQSSAPVSIPDWSKIYGKNINGNRMMMMMDDGSSSSWVDVDHNHVNGGYGYNGGEYHYGVGDYGNNNNGNDNHDDDDDDDDNEHGGVIPPHEWIAKRLARTQISSFSVCEGAGRTLKGRDLSKLRNAILTKTGFLE